MKKSGTNWVAELVATHPQAVVWGELHLELLRQGLDAYARPDWTPVTHEDIDALWPEVVRTVLDARVRAHLADHGRAARRQLFVDHTPGWVALHLGASARYIHVVRDPRDVIVSDAFHSMRLDEYPPDVEAAQRVHIDAWRTDPWYFAEHPDRLVHPAEVDRLARTWVDIVRSALTLAATRPDLVTVVRYEDVHADAVGARRSLLEHVGLNPRDAGPVLEPRLQAGFGDRGEEPTSFHRNGLVGDHVRYLSDGDRRETMRIAGDLMGDLGYR